MKELLKRVVEGEKLGEQDAFDLMNQIMQGKVSTGQLMSVLSVLRYRGETIEEMTGFARAMRSNMLKMDLEDDAVIDTCGTGGDGSSTFNISTAVAIVLAAMGVKVAKHGNRKVSSKSGSADVLELLGMPLEVTPEEGKRALNEKRMTFLYAPTYHQAMKHAVPARQELGFRTVFNLLGPISNPAQTKRQLIGIYDTNYGEKLAGTLKALGSKHVLLVTGRDGLDEITITGETDIVELKDGEITRFTVSPEEVGLSRGKLEDIQISHPTESAAIIEDIVYNNANDSARDIVLMNAAAGLYIAGQADSIQAGVAQVKKALEEDVVREYFEAITHTKEQKYA
ncbi:anthranilate phosphoribosyltransferase [Thalassobacillus devorans]|uniref:Anthranilate phosphoribosyltransferase n=1 Tax=Thalassobacillus devorans TaxID=279813 RepID=A0ABQ1PQV6_9BACI|nr:anthranilate phosphoribosyltransferase [Thalassobacillus devorans]NIK30586.1 anthranilate phosphoribosyltransferase [Thalassobacillus devorans]GGD01728.1 anthranilate phosphoribosyltransferase [Thalassobacillus devorans]